MRKRESTKKILNREFYTFSCKLHSLFFLCLSHFPVFAGCSFYIKMNLLYVIEKDLYFLENFFFFFLLICYVLTVFSSSLFGPKIWSLCSPSSVESPCFVHFSCSNTSSMGIFSCILFPPYNNLTLFSLKDII